MSSINIENEAQRYLNPRDAKIGFFPIGELVVRFSRMSRDTDTQSGILQAQEALADRGLAFLDSHLSKFDIVCTAANLTNVLSFTRFTVPAAGKHKNSIVNGYLLDQLNQTEGANIMPVNRREEVRRARAGFVHEQGLNREEIRARRRETLQPLFDTNNTYLEAVRKDFNTAESGALIAPYGSRKRFGDIESIRPGVGRVLCDTSSSALFTRTVFDPRKGGFVTYTSGDLVSFNPYQDPQEVKEIIHEEMMLLNLRVDQDLSLILR